MKKPSMLIAIPCYGGTIQDNTVSGLFSLSRQFERHGIMADLMLVANESLISTGRSNIANMFLHETNHDYIMCIDADVGFKWTDVLKLYEHQLEFVTGAYSMKIIPPKYNFKIATPIEEQRKCLIKIEHIGTGFQLVHRSVYEDIAKKYPELKYRPNDTYRSLSNKNMLNSYHYYDTMIDEGIIPEDISFCRRYNSTGGKIWLDTEINLTHAGNHIFTGIPDLKQSISDALGVFK